MQSEFKDGYWKPFSYYENLFSVGKTIRIVYEDGRKEELKIKEQQMEHAGINILRYLVIKGEKADQKLVIKLMSARRKPFGVSNITVDGVKRIILEPTVMSMFQDPPSVTMGTQPLEIPQEYKTITLKKGNKIYRKTKKMEPVEKPQYVYYYADDPLYNFGNVGKSYSRSLNTSTGVYDGDSGIYEYALSEDIKVVDLTTDGDGKKVWRCNVYSNDSDRMSLRYRAVSSDCANDFTYQSSLIEACKRRGCVGFRAYVKFDNGFPKSFDDVHAELALLGSSPVVRIDCLKKDKHETSDMEEKIKELEAKVRQIPLYENAIERAYRLKDDMEQELQQTIERLKKELEEEEEEKIELKEELEKIRAGGTPQGTSKRKRTDYFLHL
tara:strand:+ start:2814 stop:3959 length:1146 start_codon:yes stop_codon:yes gene_type:complete